MNKRIVYELPDESLTIVVPAVKAMQPGESEDDFIARVSYQDVPVALAAPVQDDDGAMLPVDTLVPHPKADQHGWAYTELRTVVGEVFAVPADRNFRNAWCWPNVADLDRYVMTPLVSVHMPRARDLEFIRLRRARDAALAALDAPQLRALVAGDTAEVQRIETLKQQLRDLPGAVNYNAATSPSQLIGMWPAGLLGRRNP